MVDIVKLHVIISTMLMFTLLEARDLTNIQPKYHGIIVENKVVSQGYGHGGRDNPPNLTKGNMLKAFRTEVHDNHMKAKGRRMESEVDFVEEVKAKVLENSGSMTYGSGNADSHETLEGKNGKEMPKRANPLNKSKQQNNKNRGIYNDSFQKLESHDLRAANEVSTLMNEDYPGNGKAHHKPPINNR